MLDDALMQESFKHIHAHMHMTGDTDWSTSVLAQTELPLTRCNALAPLLTACFWPLCGPTREPCGEYLEGYGGGKPLLPDCPWPLRIGLWLTTSTSGFLGAVVIPLAELAQGGSGRMAPESDDWTSGAERCGAWDATAAVILRLRSTM